MPGATGIKQDAKAQVSEIERMLADTVERARGAIGKVEDPHARALFETAAEVLIGLGKAFRDYSNVNEPAWK